LSARQPVLTGVVTAVVGISSAAAIVLAGLSGVGATEGQAASGLLAATVLMGACSIYLSLSTRMPLLVAWSTPGAALLATAGVPDGGWAAAIGAFLLAAALTVIAGQWRALAELITRIPAPVSAALLAGVLLPLCLAPAKAVAEMPDLAAPVAVAWLGVHLVRPGYATPAALVALLVVLVVDGSTPPLSSDLLPSVDVTGPVFEPAAMLAIGVPLFIVTMASQNVTGAAILQAFGYRPDVRRALTTTGAASAVGAPFGCHAVNLAAITAAMTASPEADPDPSRRWIASAACGVTCVVLGLGANALAAVLLEAPALLIQAAAGLALLPTLGRALAAAMEDPSERDAALVTLVASAGAWSAFGVTAPFWGLLAGLVYRWLSRRAHG
jgi:benzoate membrane transport protein